MRGRHPCEQVHAHVYTSYDKSNHLLPTLPLPAMEKDSSCECGWRLDTDLFSCELPEGRIKAVATSSLAPPFCFTVEHYAKDSQAVTHHAHHGDRVPEEKNGHYHRHSSLGIPQDLQGESAGMFGDEEVGEVDEIGHGRVHDQQEENVHILASQRNCDAQHIRFQHQGCWQEDNHSNGGHV